MDAQLVPLTRRRATVSAPQVPTVTAICARPKCRREFARGLTRGRRQLYCSQDCRRRTDAERRRSRARLRNYEDNVAQLRADERSYSSAADTAMTRDSPAEDALRTQLTRVDGLLVLADGNDPVVQQLTNLAAAARDYLDTQAT